VTDPGLSGSFQILILDGIPNGYMGTINGIAQMVAAGTRSLAPSFASSLYSVSLEKHLAGGYMVFFVLLALHLVGILCTTLIPKVSAGKALRLA